MPDPASIGIAMTAVGLVALLVAERRNATIGIWLAKPIASAGFVTLGCSNGTGGRYDSLLLAALVACAIGDVLLIPRDREAWFKLGIGAFALGHLLYVGAFLDYPLHGAAMAVCALVLGAIGVAVWRWLSPHVPSGLKAAVGGYIIIIVAMAATSVGVTWAGADERIAIGATLFFMSDLSVARDAFVRREFLNRAWGLPTYYLAQLVLATT